MKHNEATVKRVAEWLAKLDNEAHGARATWYEVKARELLALLLPDVLPLLDLRQAQMYVDEAFETLTEKNLRPRWTLTAAEIDTAAESLAHAANFLSRVRATLEQEQ